MAETDYKFAVYANSLDPFGPVSKENMDVVRLKYDFSSYLEVGETISLVQFPTIDVPPVVNPQGQGGSWRADYPGTCPDTTAIVAPVDTYPLTIVSEAIVNMGLEVDVRVQAGTPGFTYVVSFIIVGSTTRRRKQVDTLITVEEPVNGKMVGPGQLDPDIVPPIVIDGSIALPMGFDGLVFLENSANAPGIVVTLPPNPSPGQQVEFIDALGKDELYPVTFRGDGDVPVDGDLHLTFVSNIAFDVLRFVWVNTNWHLITPRFGFLG